MGVDIPVCDCDCISGILSSIATPPTPLPRLELVKSSSVKQGLGFIFSLLSTISISTTPLLLLLLLLLLLVRCLTLRGLQE